MTNFKYTTLAHYQVDAMRVKGPPASPYEDLKSAGVGLVTEVGEVVDVYKRHWSYKVALDVNHLKKELGDVLWYLALAYQSWGTVMKEIDISEVTLPSLNMALAKMVHFSSNIFSVALGYEETALESGLDYDMHMLLQSIYFIAAIMDLDIYEIATLNKEKMDLRYPDGFSLEAAVNRKDVVVECSVCSSP